MIMHHHPDHCPPNSHFQGYPHRYRALECGFLSNLWQDPCYTGFPYCHLRNHQHYYPQLHSVCSKRPGFRNSHGYGRRCDTSSSECRWPLTPCSTVELHQQHNPDSNLRYCHDSGRCTYHKVRNHKRYFLSLLLLRLLHHR